MRIIKHIQNSNNLLENYKMYIIWLSQNCNRLLQNYKTLETKSL